MITGNYSHRCTGRKINDGGIYADQPKLPELLRDAGYATYSSGKLHYVPYRKPGEPRLLHGFEHSAFAESGRILKEFDPEGKTKGVEDYFDALEAAGWKGYSRAHGLGNNDIHPGVSPLPAELNVDAWVADRAIAFLEQHAAAAGASAAGSAAGSGDAAGGSGAAAFGTAVSAANPTGASATGGASSGDRPFFLNVGFPKPHSPYDPPRPYDSLYDPRTLQAPYNKKDGLPRGAGAQLQAIHHGFGYLSPEAVRVARAHYYGLVSFQDAQVGRILSSLDALGLRENTIIVYTADHGDMLGDFGYFFKSCMYEGSTRIPLIISCPPGIAAGGFVSDALAGLQDLFPTVLELAKVAQPRPVDGASLAGLLGTTAGAASAGAASAGAAADAAQAPRAAAGAAAGKVRDHQDSYSLESPAQTSMITDGDYKFVYNEYGGVQEFYDIRRPDGEETNLIDSPAHRTVVRDLRARLLDWHRSQDDAPMLQGDGFAASPLPDLKSAHFEERSLGWRWY
jgi:arylsulfatase A-like enzyme